MAPTNFWSYYTINAYVDADWASDSDAKSVSGLLIQIGNNTIFWKTKKQNWIALSTAEAEINSLTAGVSESLFLRNVMADLGFKSNIIIYEDNQAAIKMIKNPDNNKRVKHIFTNDDTNPISIKEVENFERKRFPKIF